MERRASRPRDRAREACRRGQRGRRPAVQDHPRPDEAEPRGMDAPVNTQTLPLDESRAGDAAPVDHLYLVLAGGRPAAARWALDGVTRVEVGRGAALAVRRTGATMRLDV